MDTEDLADVLAACDGVVCLVGAGGKKSTIYQLARRSLGRVGITATAHIEPFPREYARAAVVCEDGIVARVRTAASAHRRLAFARPCPNPGRLLGISCDELGQIWREAGFDLCLVKADGARGRILKAPAAHEPAIPPCATTVIPVVSARALGQSVTERIAHRPALVAAVCGLAPDQAFAPEHLARLLASPEGSLRGVGTTATVVPVINMVDDEALAALARRAALEALALTDRFDRVLLASMRREQPIVEVVRRA